MSEISIMNILADAERDLPAFVAASEAAYRSKIESVCRDLMAGGQRVLMLAGPSSSGKTTTANILCDLLEAAGHPAVVVSLDNFYRDQNEPDYPRNPDGSLDFETVEALAIGEIHDCIEAVLAGRSYDMPHFDFKKACRDGRIPLQVPDGGIVIVEGLHALNPVLTEGLDGLYRLFISVSTNVNDAEGHRLLSGRKIRFMRRLSRDFLYRNSDAAKTYELWEKVVAGELQYLYPYRYLADCQLDTFHPYEIGVLRGYAEPLLSGEETKDNEYFAAVRAGMSHLPLIDSRLVPGTSLLREFIPGGVYESLY